MRQRFAKFVRALWHRGWTVREIAKGTGNSKSKVGRITAKFGKKADRAHAKAARESRENTEYIADKLMHHPSKIPKSVWGPKKGRRARVVKYARKLQVRALRIRYKKKGRWVKHWLDIIRLISPITQSEENGED